MRLAKYISGAGLCSRRAASRLIDDAKVLVNGELAGHLTFVDSQDEVMVNGELVTPPSELHYWLYHKPVGIDCNYNIDDANSLLNQFDAPANIRLFPVGRLDKDSRGLLLLTNDGALCHRLLSPQFKQPKQYLVQVKPIYQRIQSQRQALDQTFALALSRGVMLGEQLTHPCDVTIVSDNQFNIVLTQGLNRQIRRMALTQGFIVTDLKRYSFAQIELGELEEGKQRQLTAKEIANLLVCQA